MAWYLHGVSVVCVCYGTPKYMHTVCEWQSLHVDVCGWILATRVLCDQYCGLTSPWLPARLLFSRGPERVNCRTCRTAC